ncbi:MAG: dienelactone hydrolase family protein [Deltaproteobacteria bacterium]|nr:dienelactone hydrolase family protein [Deltaproteobacteria bacterium]MBK8713297.1 dienelactone hydrolase family protein [Deltaproteobacteria bacterium]MBP7289358.1 dienelactone hydrolase family protein [Nannocystaceae bacterium]
MCDDDTEIENAIYLRKAGLTRRELGLGTAATVASLLSGCKPGATATASTDAPPPTEPTPTSPDAVPPTTTPHAEMVTIETSDGVAEAFFVAPTSGRHPAVLIWPDIAGLRPSFTAMATRLAAQGYAVLAVNHYYRNAKMPVLESFEQWRTPEGKAKITPAREALTNEAITRDAAAFVAWLDRQPQVDTARKVGTTGYCMGGPFTLRTAAAVPARVGVIGSFHGGGLVTADADSPHRLLASTKAAALICIAQNDDEREPESKTTLRESADAAGLFAEIEVYPAQHGWCVTDSPVYDETQAERAWSRLLAMLSSKT